MQTDLSPKQHDELSRFSFKLQGKFPEPGDLIEDAAKMGALWVADACRDAAMTWQGHEPIFAGQMQSLAGQIEHGLGVHDPR